MKISFADLYNADIDDLVQLSWKARGKHENEGFIIPERDAEDIFSLISDETDDDEDLSVHPITPETLSIDLSRFAARLEQTPGISSVPSIRRLLVAVDSGIVYLGEFVNGGIACAIRGAAVCLADDRMIVLRYNTGPLLIDEQNQFELFRFMGGRLGNEKLYLMESENGDLGLAKV